MGKVRLFNPENDIMLQWPSASTFSAARTLGAQVELLRGSGAMLPVWWADAGDAVVVQEADRDACTRWLDKTAALFPSLSGISVSAGADARGTGVPWGWSGDAARRLVMAGAECPDMDALERMRMLSHRRTSIAILERLAGIGVVRVPYVPMEVRSVEELRRSIQPGRGYYMKSPWSSSGRGVVKFDGLTPKIAERAAGVIRKQGSVMIEPAMDGVMDFAMLFHVDGGMARWKGYSLFFNSHAGYAGNLLCDDAAIEERLVSAGAGRDALHGIRSALESVLSDIIGDAYCGWLGIDMLVTRDGMIAPCIELNLRMTMGVVAHYLAERVTAPGVEAVYTVGPSLPGGRKNGSPAIEAGRLVAGELMLTPPGAFEFRIAVR
ncbi:hypothetical protein [uncultured Muribaculum sp.]|uniref:hypothetical protein n=1 Tax=uncultured Muribaculum sp. TaxID=1918613 RepID=UPI0026004B61|nr:hypothetical protein [uncultured Muribaculum sp.]